jgi:2-oxoglutarate dehydrogenase E2 component (dihydrolipoamide succinyltransferase)
MSIDIKIPTVGESITEVEIGEWLKSEGDFVSKDEVLAIIETEKATVDLPAPESGTLSEIIKKTGEGAQVGDVIARLTPGSEKASSGSAADKSTPAEPKSEAPAPKQDKDKAKQKESSPSQEKDVTATSPRVMPAAQRVINENGMQAESIEGTGPGGRVLKEDAIKASKTDQHSAQNKKSPATAGSLETMGFGSTTTGRQRQEEVRPMSLLRRKVAEKLVSAQHTAALLTTFNEIDMSRVIRLRKTYQDAFVKKHSVKLGFMSFFVKAVVDGLRMFPALNAEIQDKSILYRNFQDIGVAVGGGKGLVVPVLRDADLMSLAEIELTIREFADKAQHNRIKPEDLQGGTFTISNGGVYGSLLSTPIINPPQSGVLGMHSIQDRPMAEDGQVVIKPMMYVALTYDHRIVDGKEAVSFLKHVKEVIEDPTRLLLEI